MIIDAIPFVDMYSEGDFKGRALRAFIDFLERRLGASVVQNRRDNPFYGHAELIEPMRLAEVLGRSGIITYFGPEFSLPDEPPLKLWQAVYSSTSENRSGGASFESDEDAMMATLAEGLERFVWSKETTYFADPVKMSTQEIRNSGWTFVDPRRFAGYSEAQREKSEWNKLDETTKLLWIKGESLVTGKKTYIPAQVVSGTRDALLEGEPLIGGRNTTGLATWHTQTGARLGGTLEAIERDAYMVMWLNQLTLPRISHAQLLRLGEPLRRLLDICEQYRLNIHAIQLVTDAPAHAICVVVEDISGHAPRFTFGLRAHHSLSHAIEKAAMEALRCRLLYRQVVGRNEAWDPHTPAEKIGHFERIFYWGEKHNASKLEFLIHGEEKEIESAPWEHDNPAQHLERIVHWCRTIGYECVSVALGKSRSNPTNLFIESVAIPELQPMHLSEQSQLLGGSRWREIPKLFGFIPRQEPFSAEPHPFV